MSKPTTIHPNNNELAERLNAVLPQTQCQRCGFDGCLPYARAMAAGDAKPNRCPPGGPGGLTTLSDILGNPDHSALSLDPSCGGVRPRTVAFIREDLCIGCTKCIDVCPTDAIVGAPKKLHYVISAFCTGCDLCLPPCPVDCITMTPLADDKQFSWEQWSSIDAERSKSRFEKKQIRISSASQSKPISNEVSKSSQPPAITSIETAIERAKKKAKLRLSEAASKAVK
jgi:Na+-translocating ferredoxin:NAD+ oxidoreductase subunit B